MRWDYVAANKGMGFHAPQEAQRVLGAAVELAQEARVEAARLLASYGHIEPVSYPEYDTKEKAQELVEMFENGTPPDLLATGGGSGSGHNEE